MHRSATSANSADSERLRFAAISMALSARAARRGHDVPLDFILRAEYSAASSLLSAYGLTRVV
jgi:hypothetical protein